MREAHERGWAERTVTVKTAKLLETLKKNRETHQKEYQEAMKGYKTLALKKLEKLGEKAKQSLHDNFASIAKKIEKFDPEDGSLGDVITLISSMTFNLEVPKDHTKSYDVAIGMAEWEENDKIELLQSQFQCFVQDDWEWTEQFKHLSVRYSARQ